MQYKIPYFIGYYYITMSSMVLHSAIIIEGLSSTVLQNAVPYFTI